MGMITKAVRSDPARRVSYCLPRTVHRPLFKILFGREPAENDFVLRAQRLQVLLSFPPILTHALHARTISAAQKLCGISPTEAQQYVTMELLDAVMGGQWERASGIARHCARLTDTGAYRVVSDRYKFIFFGVPRVASQRISWSLGELDPEAKRSNGLPMGLFCQQYREEIENYFTFGIRRHPLDRLWVCWLEKVKRAPVPVVHHHPINPSYGLSPDTDFPSFCEWMASHWGSDVFADRHWLSQHHFLTLPDGSPLDFTGTCENLQADWREILERIGLPHIDIPDRGRGRLSNQSEGLESLAPDLLNQLYERYQVDFELGGYGHPAAP